MSFRRMNGRRAFHSASQSHDVKSLVNEKPPNTVAEKVVCGSVVRCQVRDLPHTKRNTTSISGYVLILCLPEDHPRWRER